VLLVLLLYSARMPAPLVRVCVGRPGQCQLSALLRGPLAGTIWKGEAARVHPAYERLPKDLVPATRVSGRSV